MFSKIICKKRLFWCLLFLLSSTNLGTSVPQYPNHEATFDFVIVGGGTAGCVLARRLVEGRHTVLLIEAGGMPNPLLEIPALVTTLNTNPDSAIIYETVPQKNAALARNGIVRVPFGRTLGGSSGINAMLFNRGSPHDYNNWAKITGDSSWSYQNLLKYFRKYETYLGDNPTDQRGFSGPIPVSQNTYYAGGLSEWLEGGLELGYPIADPNGPQIVSFTRMDITQRNGRRVSAFKGYVEPLLLSNETLPIQVRAASKQGNLVVLIHTEVSRVIFDGNRAIGVKFSSTNSSKGAFVRIAKARKEVILSAGTVGTASLVLRSGVGPKSELDGTNIAVVKHLPVGRNLHDHPVVFNGFILGNKSAALDPERDLTPEAWRLYQQTGTGPYSSFLGSGVQAFLTSSVLPPSEKLIGWPDINLSPFHISSRSFFLAQPFLEDVQNWETTVVWATAVRRPKSRGTVTLDKRNIDNPALVDMQYFNHPDDMRVMIDAIKYSAQLCERTNAFQRLGCRLPSRPLPACGHFQYRSEPYWECYVSQLAVTEYHSSGTCKMGKGPEDPEAVVDSQLRAIGLDRLRIVDASIMPAITNANTQAAVYVIAEKIADILRRTWDTNQALKY